MIPRFAVLLRRWRRRRADECLRGLGALQEIRAIFAGKPEPPEFARALDGIEEELLRWAAEEGVAGEALVILGAEQ